MKKLAIIFLVISMLFLATSCDILEQILVTLPVPGGDIPNPGGGDNLYDDMTQEDYDNLNKLLGTLDDNVLITVETKKAGVVLTSIYVITEEYVKYSVQSLAMLPTDGNIAVMEGGMTVTVSGDAKINERGDFIDENGDLVSLPDNGDDGIFDRRISLDPDNFYSAYHSNVEFEGEAISAAKLLNVDTDVENVKVRIEYHDDEITFMSLYYTKDCADVYVTYEFNKA